MQARMVTIPYYTDRGEYDTNVYPRMLAFLAEKGFVTLQQIESRNIPAYVFLSRQTVEYPSSPFYAEFAIDGYQEVVPTHQGTLEFGGKGFLESLKTLELSECTPMQKLAILSLRAEAFTSDKADERAVLREFIDAVNNVDIHLDRLQYFWLMPFVFMRAKHFQSAVRLTSD